MGEIAGMGVGRATREMISHFVRHPFHRNLQNSHKLRKANKFGMHVEYVCFH